MLLMCTSRCGGRLFRALFAEVDIDSGGGYEDHRIAQPGYICLNCGSPAVDLSEVPAGVHELRCLPLKDKVIENPRQCKFDPKVLQCSAGDASRSEANAQEDPAAEEDA